MVNYLRGLVILTLMLPCGLQAATIDLPKTGQTGCWDSSGNPVVCTDTGQDGEKLKGVALPTPRFTNPDGSTPVSGGIAVDQLTGLVWAKAISAPSFTWQGALDAVAAMNVGGGTFGYTDWRLPNRAELMSVLDRQQTDALPAGHPFTNVPSNKYVWSATTYNSEVTGFGTFNYIAWGVFLPAGVLDGHTKTTNDGAYWPVRGGQFGTSVVSVLPATKDFGSQTNGSTASQQFTIANTAAGGSSSLAVNSIVLSGANPDQFSITVGDGSAGTCGSFAPVVAAGGNCTISVSFTPGSAGGKSANLRVSGSDVATPNVDIALTGTGIAPGPTVNASVSGGNGVITSADTLHPVSGTTASFTLLPDGGYQPSSTVTGTCPAGSFSGLTYTTGTITTTCDVIFSFETIPAQSVVINGGDHYTRSRKVTLAIADVPAPPYMQFLLDGQSWSRPETFKTVKPITLPSGDGLKHVTVRFLDSPTGTSLGTASSTIILDAAKPTGTIVINNGDTATNDPQVTLTLTAADATSGVESMQFSTDKVTWSDWEAFNATKNYDLPSGDGKKKVYVHYRDKAGNISATYSKRITFDTAAPTGTIKINGGAATTRSPAVTLNLISRGSVELQLSNDGETWGLWQDFTAKILWNLVDGLGDRTVSVRFRDAADNVSQVFSATITVLP